jgi:hypothetical protein
MIKRRVVAGVKGINIGVEVGLATLAEEKGIDQLEAFALVIIEREAHQIDGVGKVDVKEERQYDSGGDEGGSLEAVKKPLPTPQAP